MVSNNILHKGNGSQSKTPHKLNRYTYRYDASHLYVIFILLTTIFILSCQPQVKKTDILVGSLEDSLFESTMRYYANLFEGKGKEEYISDGFDYPVGIPDGKGYYNAQAFTKNYHLGDDWNGVGGGDSDYGDHFHAVSHGYVTFTGDLERRSGWGKVIRILHKMDNHPLEYVESLYAHCSDMKVKEGDYVKKGQIVGAIGNADGLYKSHLHFEVRDNIFMGIGAGYSSYFDGYLNPTMFIDANRTRWE
ncbi:MAG: murein DD-endopeptidase MepM/ murein hydrolase activator NlpD [Maribacter sp.]|jgi:murein DD-endopeptidase MepM/ murein hydrolase activator NlpD